MGLALCLSPLLLLVASLTYGLLGQRSTAAGLGWMIAAGLVAAFNFYLSAVLPAIFYLRHGSMESYRFVSGIPLVGTLLVVVGGILGFGEVVWALVGIAVVLLDTCGSFWFLIATWKDTGMWDT